MTCGLLLLNVLVLASAFKDKTSEELLLNLSLTPGRTHFIAECNLHYSAKARKLVDTLYFDALKTAGFLASFTEDCALNPSRDLYYEFYTMRREHSGRGIFGPAPNPQAFVKPFGFT